MIRWPEESWERLEPYVQLNARALTQIVQHTLGRGDLVQSEVLSGGKCNTNIRVSFSDATRVVVRIYERDKSASRRDQVIATLAAPTVPVPRVLAAVHEPGDELPEALGGRSLAIFEWVEGIKPFDAFHLGGPEVGAQIAHELGATLAKIGRVKRFEHHGLLDAELNYRRVFASKRASFVEYIQWAVGKGRVRDRLGAAQADRVEQYALERASLLDVTEGAFGLVHGDYKLSNLLVRPTSDGWEVAGVLDWEFALSGSPLMDVAILLRHADHWAFAFEEAFAEGFEAKGGVLPQRWREITRLLDLLNLLGFLNASGQRETTFEAVRELIRKTVERK